MKDEEPEGDVCRPAPRDTWHGAGGELRAGRRNRRRLAGPRHGRAAGQRRNGLPAPRGHRRRSPQGLPVAVPVSGFCRRRKEGCGEGAAPRSLRLGAAGVNAAERTGPGQRGGEGRGREERRGEAASRGYRPPHSTLLSGKSGALAPAALGEGRPPQSSLLSPAPHRGSPLRRRGRSPPRPRSPAPARAEVPPDLWRKSSKHAGVQRVFRRFPPQRQGMVGASPCLRCPECGPEPKVPQGPAGASGTRAARARLPDCLPRALGPFQCFSSVLPRWGYV